MKVFKFNGNEVKRQRAKLNMTPLQVADTLGMSESVIRHAEAAAGHCKMSADNLANLADLFGVKIDDLRRSDG